LYDIQPGNGAGPFLQPRSPHGASNAMVYINNNNETIANEKHTQRAQSSAKAAVTLALK